MVFKIALYTSLVLFFAGLAYRMWKWFSLTLGPETKNISIGARIAAAVKVSLKTVFSLRIFLLLKTLLLDVLLQIHLLKAEPLRWVMHICMFAGFTLLLLFHALESQISVNVFSEYESTLNPFMALRNVFGALVICGLLVAVYRRITIKNLRTVTRKKDHFAIILLAVIMVSGFVLEGLKIISYPIFDEMVEDYAGLDDPVEINALKAYWAEHYSVVFPGVLAPAAGTDPQSGEELHEENCAACHSRPQSAFISYAAAKVMEPVALALYAVRIDIWKGRLDKVLLFIHYLACFIGLAYLPHSKMFHVLTSPISLVINSVADSEKADPAFIANRRSMELDACTHCGNCTLHCSVAPVFRKTGNEKVLPSEKIDILRFLGNGKKLNREELLTIQEGSFACTSCYRCTRICPAGINLQDLWQASKDELAARGFPGPAAWAKKTGAEKLHNIVAAPEPLAPEIRHTRDELNLSSTASTFSNCFKCQTCTSVCPVVTNLDDPKAELDLLPHQVMHALGMNLKDLALNSRMIWDCLTCYQCQEHCPQGVKVTDIFYELKNIAYSRHRNNGVGPKSIQSQTTKNKTDDVRATGTASS